MASIKKEEVFFNETVFQRDKPYR
ncbi:hypothetical protein Bhyg_10495 [Pseudolycoriella hygida]|uniref:Uncharacterized protein n=1 Tax=Pseudolycoriella hygida TaxID=35572 RepID=A0A9Q0MVA9_9DIPT|nr:hypothetical protein Bhyg_10495 [Pseudolycoriella hygida]